MGNAALAAKPVNDTILLRVNWVLRAGKAYVFNEISLTLSALDTASDWDLVAQLFLGSNSRVLDGVDQRIPVPMVLMGNNGIDKQIVASSTSAGMFPRTVLQTPDQVATINMNISIQNTAAAVAAAAALDFYASFFEYDLEQAQYFPLNSAVAVISR